MRKLTIAFLRTPNPSLHAFLKRAPAPPLSFTSLASSPAPAAEVLGTCKPLALPTRMANARTLDTNVKSTPTSAKSTRKTKANAKEAGLHAEEKSVQNAAIERSEEVGALPPISMGPLQTSRKASMRTADKLGCGSLHAEILTSVAEVKAKSRPTSAKAKRKANAETEELSDIGAFKAQDVTVAAQNVGTGKAEEAALNAEEKAVQNAAIERSANESLINAKKEVSEWVAKLDLNTCKAGRQWEQTAYKLLDLGISSTHVKLMLSKCRMLLRGTQSLDSTLTNFSMLGMRHEEIGRVISRYPTILTISNYTFQSKVEYFESVGIDRSSLGKIMPKTFRAMGLSPSTLRARCEFWKDYFQDVDENALRTLILRNAGILSWNVQKTVKTKMAYLEGLGFSKKMLLRHSTILGLTLKLIATKLKLLEQFGISSVRALAVLHSVSALTLHARLHNLLALGFSFDQVQKITANFPNLLYRREDNIKLRLSYAVNVMNSSFDELVACAAFWSRSYEKVKYRYEVLQELKTLGAYQKNVSLAYMLKMSDTEFSRRFVERLQA